MNLENDNAMLYPRNCKKRSFETVINWVTEPTVLPVGKRQTFVAPPQPRGYDTV